ncbi:DNA cytosine methyltransferase [Cytobacillus sp. FSL W8-0315]|uniref:DNA cytosine methyltransferase n=1 Tax=Cytobacillus sp. FSL W8-0315 TaxID=2921600 RepID=UPI0030FC683E
MKVLELFAGTRSMSKAFEAAGHEAYTIELDEQHENISMYADVLTVTPEMILKEFGRPDIIWASPPCTSYSIAAISHHRTREDNENLLPKSEFAKVSDELVKHTLYLIQRLRPKYWFIENPRGGMRKMDFVQMLPRYTVTYCQYGCFRMKPTDIWTNHTDPQFKPMCKNGDSCHEAAPRGSKTGTQGLKNAKDRSVIPQGLCEHIVKISEGGAKCLTKSGVTVKQTS